MLRPRSYVGATSMKRNATKRKKKGRDLNLSETPEARKLANEFLQPVIDGTTGYGQKKRLADALSEATGTPVSRTTVERWLHPDPAKRQQPLLGGGLLVRAAWDRIKPQ